MPDNPIKENEKGTKSKKTSDLRKEKIAYFKYIENVKKCNAYYKALAIYYENQSILQGFLSQNGRHRKN